MYLNQPLTVLLFVLQWRLIATYDVFEFLCVNRLHQTIFRLIATYDVFEFSIQDTLRIGTNRLIATYDVFEFYHPISWG